MQIMIEEELYFKGGMDAYYYFRRLGIMKREYRKSCVNKSFLDKI